MGASSAAPTSAAPLVAPAPGGPWASGPAACCGPIGGDGPVGQEVYVRTGPSIPFGKGVLAEALNAGWNVTLGGRSTNRSALGRLLGPAFSADDVVDAVETVLETYLRLRQPGEAFVDAVDRLGIAPFKEAAYADA